MRAGFAACALLALAVLSLSEYSYRSGRLAIVQLLEQSEAAQRPNAAQAAAPAAMPDPTAKAPAWADTAADAAGLVAQRPGPEAAQAKRTDPAQEHRLAALRHWERVHAGSRLGIALACALAVLACLAAARLGAQVARERDLQRRQLQAERDALDVNVERRTEDLVRLASHLQNSREDERANLARELHDELGAVLTAAKLDVAWLGAKLKGQDAALLERLRALKSVLEDAIQLKRRIIEDLRPSLLTNLGLVPALQRLVEDQRARFAGRLDAEIDEEIELPEDIALVVYRIAQEALTNVHKYAQARSVELTLRWLPQQLELRVADDGVGFDVSRVDAARHGLAGMRHRLLSIRGTLQVDASPGCGTAITARVPLAEIETALARQAAARAVEPDEAAWSPREADASAPAAAGWPAAPAHP